MIDYRVKLAGKVAVCLVVTTAYFVIATEANTLRKINEAYTTVKTEWKESKNYQSLNDKYNAGKITRSEWVEGMHNGAAKWLWLRLSTQFPDYTHYIAKRIRQEYTLATKWV